MRVRRFLAPAGWSNTAIDPDAIFWTPTMERNIVVLPLPLGPRIPAIKPFPISKFKSGIIVFSSRLTHKLFTTMLFGLFGT